MLPAGGQPIQPASRRPQVAPLQTKRSAKPGGGEGTYVETPFHLGPAKQLAGKQAG